MAVNRAVIVDGSFTNWVKSYVGPSFPKQLPANFNSLKAIEVFESMIASRHLDIHARELKAQGHSFYTIGSSGHEANACVAATTRITDPAYLHYRSGAFFLQRAKQSPSTHGIFDILLGLVASTDEPIAGGRHKVFGSLPLNIPPQTSTIASHLPKAVGAAFTITRQYRLGLPSSYPEDSIVLCSFGDASSNHATASTAFNAASISEYQNLPLPLLFVCEDNGIGISTRTPKNWVSHRFKSHPSIKYFYADGLDLFSTLQVAQKAADFVRRFRKPAILHLRVVRLLGHAGSDVEQLYRSLNEIEQIEAKDPLISSAKQLIDHGLMDAQSIQELYENTRQRVHRLGAEATTRPKLETAEDVMAPLSPIDPDAIRNDCQKDFYLARKEYWRKLPEEERPRHMAMLINRCLADIMLKYPNTILFGEDVAKKGGVYHVTADLNAKFGTGRVFNTPLDETSILGLAIGAGQLGLLPIPEIQYLAYIHNALDQIRGEACSQQFFSNGQFSNPMVIRIASLAYQKGFGGHFHNDNSIAALRDIPGLVIACPSNGHDAVQMLRTSIAAANVNKTVVAFLEPIALYMTKDLHEDKDGLWSFPYPEPNKNIPIGQAKTWLDGTDITIITYANGLWMSLRVAKRLEAQGISCRVMDLRWLNPLPEDDILREAEACPRILVVDEGRQTGGISEGIVSLIAENLSNKHIKRLCGLDTFIPLGAAANLVLIQEADIESAVLSMMEAV